MSTPYVAGPAWVYVWIPNNFAALINIFIRPPVDATLNPVLGGIPGLPNAARLTSVPPDPPQQVQDFGALFFRVVTPLFLGTCEDTPVLDFYPAYIPVPVDESGQTYPFDNLYDGQEADIVCTLNSWNEGVAAFLMAYAAGGLVNRAVARGSDFDGYIGTLMAQEGANVPLTVVFPYAGKPQYGLAGMPPCYNYYSCRITHNGLRDLSTKPKKVLMAWRAQRLLVPGLGTLLYDNTLRPGLPFPN